MSKIKKKYLGDDIWDGFDTLPVESDIKTKYEGRQREIFEQYLDTDPTTLDKAGAFVQGIAEHGGKLADTALAAAYKLRSNTLSTYGKISPTIKKLSEEDAAKASDYWNNPKLEKQWGDAVKPDYKPDFVEQAETMDNYRKAGEVVASIPEMMGGASVVKGIGVGINLVRGDKVLNKLPRSIDWLSKFLKINPTPKNITAIGTGAVLGEKAQDKAEQQNNNSFEGYTASFPRPYDKPTPSKGENLLRSMVGFVAGDIAINIASPIGKTSVKFLTRLGKSTQEALDYGETGAKNPFFSYIHNLALKGSNKKLDESYLKTVNEGLLDPAKSEEELLKIVSENKDKLNTFTIFEDNKRAYDIASMFPSYVYAKDILPNLEKGVIQEMKNTIGDKITKFDKTKMENSLEFQSNEAAKNARTYVEKLDKEQNKLIENYEKEIYTDFSNEQNTIKISKDLALYDKYAVGFEDLAREFKPFGVKVGQLNDVTNIISGIANDIRTNDSVPINQILNTRSTLNEIAFGGEFRYGKEQKKLLTAAITKIDDMLQNAVEIGDLSKTALEEYNKFREFSRDVYYATINNEVIRAVISGEEPLYLFDKMNTLHGYLDVKDALTGSISNEHSNKKHTFNLLWNDTPYNILGKEELEKSKEIFKTLESLKIQQLLFEGIEKGDKFNASKALDNIKNPNARLLFKDILGEDKFNKFEKNIPTLLAKLKDIDYKMSLYSANLKFPKNNTANTTKSAFSHIPILGHLIGGGIGFSVGGFAGGAIGIGAGGITRNLLATGLAKASSDPKYIAKLIKLSNEKDSYKLSNFLIKIALEASKFGNASTKAGVYNNIMNKDNMPSKESLKKKIIGFSKRNANDSKKELEFLRKGY